MRLRGVAILGACAVLLIALSPPAVSQGGDGIIVNNAHEVRHASAAIPRDLLDALTTVRPRTVSQYSDQSRGIGLRPAPSQLRTLLQSLSDTVTVQYAKAMQREGLPLPPSGLRSLLRQASDRVVFQYANAGSATSLAYPTALFGAPQISDVSASVEGCGSVTITWSTDEFADSEVVYGQLPGQYGRTASDPHYVKHHEVPLHGLTRGRYYFRVQSTDPGGNISTSSEYSFDLVCLYLPSVMRARP